MYILHKFHLIMYELSYFFTQEDKEAETKKLRPNVKATTVSTLYRGQKVTKSRPEKVMPHTLITWSQFGILLCFLFLKAFD